MPETSGRPPGTGGAPVDSGLMRPLGEDQLDAWLDLQFSAYGEFGRNPPPWQKDEALGDLPNLRGVFEAGDLAAGLQYFPMDILFGEQLLPCVAIGMVATAPQYRRQGRAFEMLRAALIELRDSGSLFSPLYPFSFPFYRRLGWEHVADQVSYRVPLSDLPMDRGGTGRVRIVARCLSGDREQVEEGAIPDLQEVYRSYASRFNGMAERDELAWRRGVLRSRAGQPLRLTIVWENAAGKPGAYAAYMLPMFLQDPKDIRVREIAATSPEAYRGILAYFRNHEVLYENLALQLPPSDPLLAHLPNPRIKRELNAHFMLRIVNLAPALEALATTAFAGPGGAPRAGDRLVLHVGDTVCPWNDGTWRLEASGGTGKVTRVGATGAAGAGAAGAGTAAAAAAGSEPWVRLSIGVLAQVVCGYLTADAAASSGRLEASGPEALALLGRLSGGRPAYLSEYF